jgi:hypothetical protein
VAAQAGLVKVQAAYPQAQMALLGGLVAAGATTILPLRLLRAAQGHLGKVLLAAWGLLMLELVTVAAAGGLVVLALTGT